MNYFRLAFTTFLVYLLQTTLLPILTVRQVHPDLLLLFVAGLAFYAGSTIGGVLGLIVGLLVDLAYGKVLGMWAIAYMLTGFFVGLLDRKLFRDNIFVPMLVGFGATVVNGLLFWLLNAIYGSSLPFLTSWHKIIFPTAVIHTVLAPVLFPLIARCFPRQKKYRSQAG